MTSPLAIPGAFATAATVFFVTSVASGVGGCSGAAAADVNGTSSIAAQTDSGSGAVGSGAGSGGSASGGDGNSDPGTGGSTGSGAQPDDAGSGSQTPDAGSDAPAIDAGRSTDAAASDDGPGATTTWDLSGWTLQLPIGSTDDPKMIDNPTGFSDAYFYIDTDGALTFMDPRTGVTTSGSLHCRSELKEDTSGWSASGTNVMTATVAVPLVPQTTTIAQIFQAPSAPSKPLLELQYLASGKLQVLLESTNQGGSSTTPEVGTVTPGAKFDYTVALSNNEIAITINGKTTNLTVPSSFDGEKFYFKWGDYDQTATSGAESTTPGTIVKFYAHSVTHS